MLGRSPSQLLRTGLYPAHRTILKNPSTSTRAVYLHGTSSLQSISPLRMPALSPTMEAGQISKWNVKTGDRFSAGDVLLTIETDKAEVDVEAQDDGYMGSQLFGPGTKTTTKTINVGEVIAILGEQEEDIKATDVPSEWNSQNSSTSSDHNSASAQEGQAHSPSSTVQSQTSTANPPGQVLKTLLPLSPAVSRILNELGVKDATKIKGTGLRGRLTKGDVLTHFKKASSPSGTAQKMIQADADARLAERSKLGSSSSSKSTEAQDLPPLDASAVRLFITEGLSGLANRSSTPFTASSFDSLLDDYSLPSSVTKTTQTAQPVTISGQSNDKYFEGFV
ncbi:hypothetical protein PGT21_018731 [Puccinia graminis f. sp. tritici]|uniref:Pyridoxine biosynthesis protein n=1 Tax=Puccinia graminis f. sp. tritici TaxID=56615 RepID=A0A5B0LTV6_PUCGR|nr:hypothetical protein PGT21_018731 [Puccinia graminis f. sp. tritici]KAA1093398.1 hypothetical protein PGTUg99_007681 [Puccinia graminis f. sp. tritici]